MLIKFFNNSQFLLESIAFLLSRCRNIFVFFFELFFFSTLCIYCVRTFFSILYILYCKSVTAAVTTDRYQRRYAHFHVHIYIPFNLYVIYFYTLATCCTEWNSFVHLTVVCLTTNIEKQSKQIKAIRMTRQVEFRISVDSPVCPWER